MAGVKQTRDGAVGILTLDEPASLNAMTPDLLGGLAAAIGEITDALRRARARADRGGPRVLLRPEPQGVRSARQRHRRRRDELLLARVPRAARCRVPIVVAVNGVAAGGGFSLAMAGDIIVAARSASLIQVFSRIGLVPDLGSSWLLPRLIGRQRALELMLLNEPLSGRARPGMGTGAQVVERRTAARRGDEIGAAPRCRPDARAGRHPRAAGGKRTRELRRPVPPRDRGAGGDSPQRGCAGRPQRVRRKTQGRFSGR